MLVTLSGIEMPVRLLHPEKTLFPMLVMPSGIVMLVRLLQSEKAPPPILVTPSGIVILVKLLHPEKAVFSIFVTLSGIEISVRLLQSLKAEFPMFVTPSSMITCLIFKAFCGLFKGRHGELVMFPVPLIFSTPSLYRYQDTFVPQLPLSAKAAVHAKSKNSKQSTKTSVHLISPDCLFIFSPSSLQIFCVRFFAARIRRNHSLRIWL